MSSNVDTLASASAPASTRDTSAATAPAAVQDVSVAVAPAAAQGAPAASPAAAQDALDSKSSKRISKAQLFRNAQAAHGDVDENAEVVVRFDHVSKHYKLYKRELKRLLSSFSKKVKYTTVKATNDVSFEVRKGETVALLGKNGAGKSTILKMVVGVSQPTQGTVEVNGKVSALLELKAGFDSQLTGRQNILLRSQIWGLTKKEGEELLPSIIEFADIGQYIDQPMRTYSSGMKSRLGFAFASSIKPDILIVDEALAVGDRDFKRKCLERINGIVTDENVTVMFVTHNTASAREFCRRGIVLEKGTVKFDGPIDEAIEFYEGGN